MADDSDGFRQCIAREFPAMTRQTYFDTACIGIASRRAIRAVSDFAHSVQCCPEISGTEQHSRLNAARVSARPLAARLIGADPSDIALVESTTHGLAVAAQALPLQADEEVLMCDLEFIQMGVVWGQLSRNGVKVRVIPASSGAITVDMIRPYLGPKVRVLAVSSVQWTNGFRADLATLSQLCREQGIWLVVDAAQHLGAWPVNVKETPVDVLACGGHKWLNSPFGAGILYLSPRIRGRLRRPISGFFAVRAPDRTWGESFTRPDLRPLPEYHFTDDAVAWEIGGTGNYPGAIGLAASISVVLELQPHRIARHIAELTDHLIEGLDRRRIEVVSPRAAHHRAGIVTFSVGPGSPDLALMKHLHQAGVAVGVRYISGVGGVRVSCHVFNSARHVEQLLEELDAWARRRVPRRAPAPTPSCETRPAPEIVRQRTLIDALDDDLMGLVAAREQVSRGIQRSRLGKHDARTDLTREREVVERFHDRLGPSGTRLALELLRMSKGHT
ncbi:aminotransferase class V-fold PLP-dependent enzyme [Streptomyces lavendulae]|uniref:aminotransferase class V-fold PLP-dependent enzyme n=1 Tax=Streptomyces lavendulae TaxID=1914 RepID=UPI0036BDF8E3